MQSAILLLLAGCGSPPDSFQADGISWAPDAEIGSVVSVSWEQHHAATAWVDFKEEGDETWYSSPPVQVDEGPSQALVLGVPFDTAFSFRVANDFGQGPWYSEEMDAATGPLPEGFVAPIELVREESAFGEDDRWLLGSVNADPGGWTDGNYWTWILDRQARVVWARLTPDQHWTLYPSISRDGSDLLIDDFTYWSGMDGGEDSKVIRLKIDGSEVRSYATPGGHHAFVELPDESVVWGSAGWTTETLEQVWPDGSQARLWDCQAFHDSLGIQDPCQSNSLFWDEPTDSFLYSFYTTSGLVQIDHATGLTLRMWGGYDIAYGFDPQDSAFLQQHGVSITGDGTLLLSTAAWQTQDTAVREYAIDDESRLLREVWSFGEGQGILAESNGDAARLANADTLHNYGTAGRLREVTPDGEVVWDLDWQGDHLLGKTQLFKDLYALAP